VSAHDARESAATRTVGLVRGVVGREVILSTVLDPLLRLPALARYSSISVRKLREYLQAPSHPLPYFRVGGRVLVRVSEFDRWLTAYRGRANAEVGVIVDDVVRSLRAGQKDALTPRRHGVRLPPPRDTGGRPTDGEGEAEHETGR
jgi:hypothetical protein